MPYRLSLAPKDPHAEQRRTDQKEHQCGPQHASHTSEEVDIPQDGPEQKVQNAEDEGPAAVFRERMKLVADTIPNGNGRLLLLPGLGHVPHMEAPEKTFPPLVAFLKEGLGNR